MVIQRMHVHLKPFSRRYRWLAMLGFVTILAAYRSSVETLTLERVTAVDILQKIVEHKGRAAIQTQRKVATLAALG